MELMGDEEKFQVSDSDVTFQRLVREAPDELANIINEKAVIILPSHGTKDAFYRGTLGTLDFFVKKGVDADIYSCDEGYKELTLHCAEIWLGAFFVKNFIIPVFCDLVVEYIFDFLKARKSDKISLRFIVEKQNGDAFTVSYDGKVENVHKALDAVKEFSGED